MYIFISNLLLESIFDSGSSQTENTQIRVFAYFQFDHFPKSKIDSESGFEMRIYIRLLHPQHLYGILTGLTPYSGHRQSMTIWR